MTEPIPRLPEEAQVVLKRRKQNDARRIKRTKIDAERRTGRKGIPKIKFQRAESFIAAHRHREHERAALIRKHRAVRNEQSQRAPATTGSAAAATDTVSSAANEPINAHYGRIIFAIRTSTTKVMDFLQRRALKALRLNRKKAAVFLCYNATSAAQLQMLSDHTLWGTPSARIVRELLFKRARAVVSGAIVPLNDNRVVERVLGAHNIICVEDLLVELLAERASAHFSTIARFIAPMRIAVTKEVLNAAMSRQRHMRPDGDFAARQVLMDSILSKIL